MTSMPLTNTRKSIFNAGSKRAAIAVAICLTAAIAPYLLSSSARAESSNITGTWAITSGGEGIMDIYAASGGWVGSPRTDVDFGSGCIHEPGERTWQITNQTVSGMLSEQYTGGHLYYNEDCTQTKGYGPATWALTLNEYGELNKMKACSTGPDGGDPGCSELKRVSTSPSEGGGDGDGGSAGNEPPTEDPPPPPPPAPPQPPQPDTEPPGTWWDKFLDDLFGPGTWLDILGHQSIHGSGGQQNQQNQKATVKYSVNESANVKFILKWSERGRPSATFVKHLEIKNVSPGKHKAVFKFSRSDQKKLRRLVHLDRRRGKGKVKFLAQMVATDAAGNSSVLKRRHRL